MSLCYDFQKWTIITMLAILTVCLVGIINLGYGEKDKDKDKDKEEIPFDCIPHET